MQINRKLEIVEIAIKSISGHSDEDSTVLMAALNEVQKMVDKAKAEVIDRAEADVASALGYQKGVKSGELISAFAVPASSVTNNTRSDH